MKIKNILIIISSGLIVFVLAIIFIRYRQIISISNYIECDSSPGKRIIILGKRICTSMDGRKFDYTPINDIHEYEILTSSRPDVPIFFNSKIEYIAYSIYSIPKDLYKNMIKVSFQIAEYVLVKYFYFTNIQLK